MSTSFDPKADDAGLAAMRPTWVRWHIVALLMAYSFTSWFNRVSISVADRPIQTEFQLTSFQIGLIDSSLLLAYTLCMTPGGWFIDRFGPRMALMVMGFGTGLFVAATGLAGHAWLGAGLAFVSFLMVRACMGVFSAPIYPASGKMVSHWVPATQRAWANGLITGAAPVGMAVSHVLFGHLVDAYTWRVAFLITGSFTALLALAWRLYVTDYPSQHRLVNLAELKLIGASQGPASAVRTDWLRLLRNRSLVLLTLSYAAVGYFEYLFNFCSEYYFKNVLEIPETVSRQYSSVTNLAMGAAMPLGGLCSDWLARRCSLRFGRAAVPVAGMLGSAATLFAATFTRDPHWTMIWFVLANASIGATEGSFWTTAIALGGRWGATAGGIVNTGGNAGGALAPSVTRGLGQLFNNWGPSFYVGSLVCLAGVVLWWWIDPNDRVADGEEICR
jgi:MFS family permease